MPLWLAAVPGHHRQHRERVLRELVVSTPRLDLVAGTAALVRAQLAAPDAWQQMLGARATDEWPPELTEDVWEATSLWLENDPGIGGWALWYVVSRADGVLVGTVGFKGRPDDDGTVEIGYSIVPSRRRAGLATEAVGGLVQWAFGHDDVRQVIAHTYPHLTPSIGVLTKLGFTRVDGFAEAGTIRFAAVSPRYRS